MKRKVLKTANLLYDYTIIIVFLIVLLIAGYYIYDAYYVYTHTLDNNIQNYKPSKESIMENTPITDDMVAWISIDNTNIDYPIMQANNNLKYLNTDPYGEYSLSGSIFLDCRNDPYFNDSYSILYGHHMEYKKMFGSLDKFLDKNYAQSHRTGKLIIGKNAEKIYKLKVFACTKSDAKNSKLFTPGKSDNVLEEIRNNATTIILDELDSSKRIIALTTCSSHSNDDRLLVFCSIMDDTIEK